MGEAILSLNNSKCIGPNFENVTPTILEKYFKKQYFA